MIITTGNFKSVRIKFDAGEWTGVFTSVNYLAGIPADVPLEMEFPLPALPSFNFTFPLDAQSTARFRKVMDQPRKKAAYLRRYARGAR